MKKLFFLIPFLLLQNCIADFRELVILLDWANERIERDLDNLNIVQNLKSFGPVSNSLTSAILQKIPILTTATLWKNFVLRKQIFNDFVTDDLSILIKKYQGKFKQFATEEDIKTFAEYCKLRKAKKEEQIPVEQQGRLNSYFRCYQIQFLSSQWRVEKFNNYFYLLLPLEYLENLKKPGSFAIAQKNFLTSLSDDELLLGLKKGVIIENPLLNSIETPLKLKLGTEFEVILPQLFITGNDLQDKDGNSKKTEQNKLQYLHEWLFYLVGHGAPIKEGKPGIIAGLFTSYFKRVLAFFNNQIETKLLLYVSCFVGGKHLLAPYEHSWFYPSLLSKGIKRKEIIPEVFNYIIIASGLSYLPTQARRIYFPNYKAFFKDIKEYFYIQQAKKRESDLFNAINYVYPLYEQTGELKVTQLPVIRYPGIEWFSIINIDKKIFELTRVLVETREAEAREIPIIDKELIIVYPEKLPISTIRRIHSEVLVPVRIKKDKNNKLPAIISSAANPATHYFEQLIIENGGLSEILRSFLIVQEHYGRTFYIKQLTSNNDIIDYQSKMVGFVKDKPIDLYNVIILVNDINPLDPKDPKKYNGIIFSTTKTGDNNFMAYWPSKSHEGKMRILSARILPDLQKIEKKVPQYPYKIQQAKLKKIFEVLEKRKESEKPIDQPKSEKEEIIE
ncbi:MAG: hypothetical protein WDZ41_02270 [Candidatus Babeliales bacterium]